MHTSRTVRHGNRWRHRATGVAHALCGGHVAEDLADAACDMGRCRGDLDGGCGRATASSTRKCLSANDGGYCNPRRDRCGRRASRVRPGRPTIAGARGCRLADTSRPSSAAASCSGATSGWARSPGPTTRVMTKSGTVQISSASAPTVEPGPGPKRHEASARQETCRLASLRRRRGSRGRAVVSTLLLDALERSSRRRCRRQPPGSQTATSSAGPGAGSRCRR